MLLFAILGLGGSLLAENLSLDRAQYSKQEFLLDEPHGPKLLGDDSESDLEDSRSDIVLSEVFTWTE